MQKKAHNYAFIDSQNVNLSIRSQGWKLDLSENKLEYKKRTP